LCEKVVSLLAHLKDNHKDITAVIKLQKALVQRRKALNYLKTHDFLAYAHVLRAYGLADLKSVRGEDIHKGNMWLPRKKYLFTR
jgi:ribosomal protein S15P/S13E